MNEKCVIFEKSRGGGTNWLRFVLVGTGSLRELRLSGFGFALGFRFIARFPFFSFFFVGFGFHFHDFDLFPRWFPHIHSGFPIGFPIGFHLLGKAVEENAEEEVGDQSEEDGDELSGPVSRLLHGEPADEQSDKRIQLGREIADERRGGRGSEEIGVIDERGVEEKNHAAMKDRKVGQNEDHHDVLQQIHRVKRRLRQEVARRHARAENEHALDDHALRQRQRENGEEAADGVGLRMDGRGAVGVGVELRVGEKVLVGVNAFDDESDDGDLE